MGKHANIQPVILCGGSGSRLWPLSRTEFPKQFLRLDGSDSLFQKALVRLSKLGSAPIIVSNEDHRFLIRDQMIEAGQPPERILLEPVGRNTAPALALAANAACETGEDPILIVTPADQLISDISSFDTAVDQAVTAAREGSIVLLGIKPDRPETAYGYIHALGSGSLRRVENFVEKPNSLKAREYLDAGDYFWNSGIFVLRASVWQKMLLQFRPDISVAVAQAWERRTKDNEFLRPGYDEFVSCASESIDYAVMEKCIGNIAVNMVTLEAGWSDLGSWHSVWQTASKDKFGNSTIGDVLLHGSNNILVRAESRLVAVLGVDNIVIIETPDAVMVADRAHSQEVRRVVKELSDANRAEHTQHRKVYRPWGWYDSIDQGECFKVKRIMVNPGASLSLQKHRYRAEHWVVVSGTAKVECGEKTLVLNENQSTYIPLGEVHRLSNPSTVPLEIIEVQSGTYLGEDDIVRIEDKYGRQ